MSKKFKQFRYYGDNSLKNNITAEELVDGSIFTSEITNITQLGVRAIPGTEFYINDNANPIIIGFLGIFELDFQEGSITSLKFNQSSINAINQNVNGGYIIVDILGNGG